MTDQWKGFVNVKWKSGSPATAWESWKGNPRIKSAWSTSGKWDCALWVSVGPDELEEFVWKEIRKNPWVETTETNWAKQWF